MAAGREMKGRRPEVQSLFYRWIKKGLLFWTLKADSESIRSLLLPAKSPLGLLGLFLKGMRWWGWYGRAVVKSTRVRAWEACITVIQGKPIKISTIQFVVSNLVSQLELKIFTSLKLKEVTHVSTSLRKLGQGEVGKRNWQIWKVFMVAEEIWEITTTPHPTTLPALPVWMAHQSQGSQEYIQIIEGSRRVSQSLIQAVLAFGFVTLPLLPLLPDPGLQFYSNTRFSEVSPV